MSAPPRLLLSHPLIHAGGYNAIAKAMECRDLVADCSLQARTGQGCDREGMVGPGGSCRKTCKDCVQCAAGDMLCGRRNMRGIRRRENAGKT